MNMNVCFGNVIQNNFQAFQVCIIVIMLCPFEYICIFRVVVLWLYILAKRILNFMYQITILMKTCSNMSWRYFWLVLANIRSVWFNFHFFWDGFLSIWMCALNLYVNSINVTTMAILFPLYSIFYLWQNLGTYNGENFTQICSS